MIERSLHQALKVRKVQGYIHWIYARRYFADCGAGRKSAMEKACVLIFDGRKQA